MVFRKGNNGKLDWVKSLAVITAFGAFVLYGLTMATKACNKSDVTSVRVDSIDQRLDRIESKLDKALERK